MGGGGFPSYLFFLCTVIRVAYIEAFSLFCLRYSECVTTLENENDVTRKMRASACRVSCNMLGVHP
jgi:hypothetical protein